MSGKKIHQNTIIGQQGVNLIEKVCLEMGFLWNPTGGAEAGIDGRIELRDSVTGEVLNQIILVQSKATAASFQAETSEGFDYTCEARDLDYWLQGNAPMILVVSRPTTDEAYWISIKDYFRDLAVRQTRKVHFDKRRDRFDGGCRSALMQLAVPKDMGIYLSPPPRVETLYSNLLEVTGYGARLYVADTEYRTPGAVWARLRELGGGVGGEWLLREKRILSFHNLAEEPWRHLCDLGTLEDFETLEWASSEDADRQREFVWLLNRTLSEKLGPTVRFNRAQELYYFRATDDLSARSIAYRNVKREVKRVVFQPYFTKADANRVAYYRHSAFAGQFLRFDGTWYLQITPTYYYTWNGYELYRFYEPLLKGIKRLDRNPAVFGQLLMWAAYLNGPEDMFTPKYPFLEFGSLGKFFINAGIDDESWIVHEDQPGKVARVIGDDSSDQLALFDDES